MKVAILAGGRGSRLGESVPKPLAQIGGRPLIWHVMMHYRQSGFSDFVIALGHGGDAIRRCFAESGPADWSVMLVDTGEDTMTGGRIKRLAPHLDGGTFMLTWADGLADVDLTALLAFHRSHGRLATLTAVAPPPRFGRLTLDGDRVTTFVEKPPGAEGWINGAFFVLEPEVLDMIDGDSTAFEAEPLPALAARGQLMAWRHTGFWDCVDAPADLAELRRRWDAGDHPWATWEKAACASS
jgi:glucose-1-phosphate cytidylyltransferase